MWPAPSKAGLLDCSLCVKIDQLRIRQSKDLSEDILIVLTETRSCLSQLHRRFRQSESWSVIAVSADHRVIEQPEVMSKRQLRIFVYSLCRVHYPGRNAR